VQEQRAAVQEQYSREWHERYDVYRQTATWQNVRRKVLERDAWLCQACRNAEATQVHHLTYETANRLGWGNEPLWELQSICRACHRRLHGITDDGEEYPA
jgi:5-methylcytosine-specific restriction endonuclease McrA